MGVISSQQLTEHHRTLTAQRLEHSQVIYNQGLLFLKQAHTKKFQNPEHLQEAGQAFLKAHQITSDNPNPGLGFAYILLLLENHTLARQYAQQVLEKHPQDRLAQAFVKRIESDLLGEVDSSVPVSDLEQYEYIDRQVQLLVQATKQTVPPFASSDPEQINRIELDLAKLQKQHLDFLSHLKSLDWGYSNASLSFTLQPLETLIADIQACLRLSKGFAGMYKLVGEDIAQLNLDMHATLSAHQADTIEALEKRLEWYLDRADAYGLKLENLRQLQQQDLRTEAQLQRYQLQLDLFRDLLDEAIVRQELREKQLQR